jgi:hypothetical protein
MLARASRNLLDWKMGGLALHWSVVSYKKRRRKKKKYYTKYSINYNYYNTPTYSYPLVLLLYPCV